MSELHDDEIEVIDFEPVTETKRGFSASPIIVLRSSLLTASLWYRIDRRVRFSFRA